MVISIYSGILNSPFIFDDLCGIYGEPRIRLHEFSWPNFARAICNSRPVATFSFALNYYFHQYQVWGYHLTNLLIHIITAILLFYLFDLTLTLTNATSRYTALMAATLWLMHPLQIQSVTYIIQRMNSMAALFYLLALLLYIKGRQSNSILPKISMMAGCLASGCLSLGCKENALTLPFIIFLYEWFFFQNLSRQWLRRWRAVLTCLVFLSAAAIRFYTGLAPWYVIQQSYLGYDFTLHQRLLTEFRVVVYYLTLIFFPHPARLNLDYDFPVSLGLTQPMTTGLSVVAIICLLGAAIKTAHRQRLFSFCILWFLLNLVIESSIIGLDLVFEHRLYLPSMFVMLMLVSLTKLLPIFCCIVCAIWTFERNHFWADDIRLWQDCILKTPTKDRSYNNLGLAMAVHQDYNSAMDNFLKALEINPFNADARNNVGIIHIFKGRTAKGLEHFSKALQLRPNFAKPHYNIGNALQTLKRQDEAAQHFREALRIEPEYAEVHNNLALIYILNNQNDLALQHYKAALAADPMLPVSHFILQKLASIYAADGQNKKALALYKKMIQSKADKGVYYYNVACLYARLKDYDQSVLWLQKAINNGYDKWKHISIDPDLEGIRSTYFYQSLGLEEIE